MRLPIAIVIGTTALLGACTQPAFDPEDPAILAAIESHFESAVAGADAVDADRVLEMAEGEGELTFVTGDVMLEGLDPIRARFEETYAGLESQEHTVLEKRVRILGPDVALVMAVGEGTYTDKAGWTSEPVGIGVTIVFVREGDAWRARHVHQSIAH
jgi:uncharacterized protein (TIGR02246 family)